MVSVICGVLLLGSSVACGLVALRCWREVDRCFRQFKYPTEGGAWEYGMAAIMAAGLTAFVAAGGIALIVTGFA